MKVSEFVSTSQQNASASSGGAATATPSSEYEIVYANDEDAKNLTPIENVSWDHQQKKVILRPSKVTSFSGSKT